METFLKRWATLNKKEKYIVIVFILFIISVIGVGSYFFLSSKDTTEIIDIKKETTTESNVQLEETVDLSEEKLENTSPLSGLQCDNYKQRPISVMMAGDVVARPLSGLSQAEIVVEMPVITGSVTRLMGVFVCNLPEEVGSIRSARHDYISLVRGWDSIYVHWGGSHFALDELKSGKRYTGEDLGKIPDIDALSSSGPFFRKSTVPAPHNGFVSLPKVIDLAKSRGYALETSLEGYKFKGNKAVEVDKSSSVNGTLYVGFGGVFATSWAYDKDSNTYTRYWSGQKDSDRGNNNSEIKAKNIIVIRASSRQIEGQYNEVTIYGEGEGKIYQNGKEKNITWKKSGFKDMIRFYGDSGEEISLTPGQTFIQVIEPGQSLKWESN
ncbi:MAG: hypothetical protein RLZZ223_30 [Candidatus Parcubacteria bacterium]|jgi:hypothetical protein